MTVAASLPLAFCLQVLPSATPAFAQTWAETTGGVTHTWTNYTNAGGTEGPSIPSFDTVQIACRLTGFKVADGNTWWYQIASSPWDDVYYASADAFYNNGATSGPLKGTPFVDPSVPICGSNSQGGTNETTGGVAHTWTDYTDAGGTQGPSIASNQTVSIACRLTGFKVADGNTWWYLVGSAPWDSQFYVSADAFYNNGQTSGSLLGTPFVDPNVPICSSSNGGGGSNGTTYTETVGGAAHTWTDYSDAGGTQGPTIAAFTSVQIACKVTGFKVADGNTWWYQIASSPWSDGYYVSADAFYNNGQTSGSLIGTPFVDAKVPGCATPSAPKPDGETTGGSTNTWTNYTNAGGTQGPSIAAGSTVTVTCRITGFAVGDGDSWWYLIGSAPWNSLYYASADAFYNNGQTSGSLQGTPFVDTNVPICSANAEEPGYGTAVGSSSGAVNPNRCNSADPVDCASGDFWQTYTDVSVSGRGPALDLTRTYNALDGATAGIFGNGWSSSYDQHLTFNTDGSITVTLADGAQVVTEPNGSGGLTVPQWADSSLVVNSDGTYTYTRQSTQFLTFAAGSAGATGSTGGQLLSIKDLNGYASTLSYNASGQLASVTDSSGRAIDVTFGVDGFVSSVTDPMGRTTTYGYNAAGDLTSVTDPASRTWDFGYNASHQMLTMTDPAGGVTTNSYDSDGRVTAQTDPQNLTTTFTYTGDNFSALGGTTTITDPHGNVEVEQYANGFMTELTKGYGTPAAGTWTYTYDPSTFGIVSVTDPDGNVTTHTYDGAGHLLTTTDPLGNTTSNTYNAFGQVLTTTDPLGHVTTKSYDASWNLLTSTDPLGNTTTYSYGDGNPGDVTSITDPSGRVTAMTYDGAGDVATKAVSPSSGETDTTAYAYDADGEVVCMASPDATAAGVTCPAAGAPPAADTTTTTYDGDGETTSVTDPAGNTTSYSYDAAGNQVQEVDASGNVTTSSYDADNRVTRSTTGGNGATPSTTAYAYDLAPGTGGCQNLTGASYCTTVTNPNGGITVDDYNARDELIQQNQPGGLVTRYGYDAAGNKLTMTDAAGTANYGYDAGYHLISAMYSDPATPNVTYAYDADGRRTAMTDGTGTTSYAYDAAGRPTSVKNGAGSTVAYGYDASGAVTSLTYPGGQVVTRTFDGAGRLASVTDWLGNATTFSYDPSGNVITTSYPNGDTVSCTYNNDNALTGTAVAKSGTALASIAYIRNADDLITKETASGAISGATNYSYSAQNQLTGAGASSFGYDPAGNLTDQAGTTQAFNAADELTTSTARDTTTSYGYDSIGDLTSAALPSGTGTDYTYNQLGELTSVAQVSPEPAVTALATADGPAAGGTSVTITGSGFTSATAVDFGTVAATFTVVSDTSITATAPAQAAGTVDVTVTTAGGASQTGPADQFSYLPVPVITGIAPDAGATGGGAVVTITGTGFTDATAVTFGTKPAAGFSVVSDTELTATTPAGATGSVDVTVATPGGASPAVAADRYTYAAPPAVTGVSPLAGPIAGGTTVTISGAALAGATGVSFGGKPAAGFSVISDTQISATAPAELTGTVDITVTTPGGTSPVAAADHFSYFPVPAITTITPAVGSTSGGTVVTITGTGFTGTTGVSFAGHAATSFTVVSDTRLTATAPAEAAGTADVAVTTPGGTSPAGTADQFTYQAVPTITKISPTAGPLSGGTTVTLTGSGFSGATAVSFGSVAATKFTVVSGTQVTATAPAQAAGTVDIAITTPGGGSSAVAADRFTYTPGPIVNKITPSAGPVAGGTVVTITGTGFHGATVVKFGTQAATSITVTSSTQITATAPAHAAGTVDVEVHTPGGVSPSVTADRFTFAPVPAVTQVSPAAGPVAGGTTVTIAGTGLSRASAVLFGTIKASHVTVVSSTKITASAPAHGAGSVHVTVTTPGGASPPVKASTYTYAPVPAVTQVSPAAGSTAGGTTVTITGTGLSRASAVLFGTVKASHVTVVSSTKITASSPAHAAGSVNVTVTTPGGTTAIVKASRYTYTAAAVHFRVPAISRLSTSAPVVNVTATYTYNGDGLRISEATGSSALSFVWDTSQANPQVLSDGNDYFIYGPDGLPIEQIDSQATPSYFFHDANGSTRVLLDSSGKVGASYAYSPYGALSSRSGSLTTPVRYGQGYSDPQTGLIYLVNRYYDPSVGLFLSVDPLVSASSQPYQYSADDPVNNADPTGRLFCFSVRCIKNAVHSPLVGLGLGIVDAPEVLADHVYDLAKTEFQFDLHGCFYTVSRECDRLANDDIINVENIFLDQVSAIRKVGKVLGPAVGVLQYTLIPAQASSPGLPASSQQPGCGPIQQSINWASSYLQPAAGGLQGSFLNPQW